MHKIILLTGAAMSGLSVIIGAFGAHALKKILEQTGKTEVFETAARYQFYHALGLLLLGILVFLKPESPDFRYAYYGILAGVLVFSGSLYALSISGFTKLGAITPIGGLLLIVGWFFVCRGIWRVF